MRKVQVGIFMLGILSFLVFIRLWPFATTV